MRTAEISLLGLAMVLAFLLPVDQALAGCPAGTVQVGEKRVPRGNVVVVHPLCKKTNVVAPAARNLPFEVKVAEVVGEIVIRSPAGQLVERERVVETPLVDGTSLATGSQESASVNLEDGTNLTLGRNTELRIQRLNGEPAPEGLEFLLDIKQGFLRWRDETSKRLIKRRFGVRVVTVPCAVRGTDFDASVTGSDSGFVRVRTGVVEFWDASRGVMGEIRAGQTLSISNGRVVGVK